MVPNYYCHHVRQLVTFNALIIRKHYLKIHFNRPFISFYTRGDNQNIENKTVASTYILSQIYSFLSMIIQL